MIDYSKLSNKELCTLALRDMDAEKEWIRRLEAMDDAEFRLSRRMEKLQAERDAAELEENWDDE